MLGMPAVYVQAHLEAMWQPGYEAGNPRLGDSKDVELAAEWEDSGRAEGEWFKAVLNCGWIDDLGGVFQIHDLLHHCPDYVKKRAKREFERINKELCPKTAPFGAQRQQTAPNGNTPAPAPAPAPKNKHPSTDVCSEPANLASEPQEEPVLFFPIVGQKNGASALWPLFPSLVGEFGQSFPSLDILGECRQALAWVNASPHRRKTERGMRKFLTGWLGRSQNSRGGISNERGSAHDRSPARVRAKPGKYDGVGETVGDE